MSFKQPVRYPVKYYSHLDAEAPQLADADGAIKTILKACLVTGYGTKEGAGWTSLFEDDFRIVLRRPLRTGNPPDIKIENGMINGVASHRIVSQDNPSGLDDATKLAANNLLAIDNINAVEWHLIVSDFGFMFCYQKGEFSRSGTRNHALYVGGCSKLNDADQEFFVSFLQSNVGQDGRTPSSGSNLWLSGLVGGFTGNTPNNGFLNMRNNVVYKNQLLLNSKSSEKSIGGDFFAQSVIIEELFVPPFYCAVSDAISSIASTIIYLDGRPMLRYLNRGVQTDRARILYIPLDYWEL